MDDFGLRPIPIQIGIGRLLLVACSARKYQVAGLVPAHRLYRGVLLQLSLRLAERYGFEPWILSAKYGFIHADSMISYYDQKLTEPYAGSYPGGRGYYVGSDLYFGRAPQRFRRLLPRGLGIGEQAAYLKRLLLYFEEPA